MRTTRALLLLALAVGSALASKLSTDRLVAALKQIWVSHEEASRIARQLNLSLQRFLDGYTKQYTKYKGWRMLKTQEGETQPCIFLVDNKCSIHTVRPGQCSTYPWWPELTVDREWEWEKANICEGFDHPDAEPLDVESAARQLREANKMTQLRLLASTVRQSARMDEWAENVLIWDEELGPGQYGAPEGKGGAVGGGTK
ncbi:hypothetical protein TSOC_005395 [Tetrabaena socialis]|uniref:YkgJ family cysteine cluster protein n=1 Tax=Tetrabaena socialis TaxID=47790 RepID=A0A2J8A6F4_9CHLO|nr:hypothetical protein TSOC_005395 [Tetrabaena socialis]|eukprot:PNH08077.1 hypothetical protein TSOC_005395 [Tetrabaena socialis]